MGAKIEQSDRLRGILYLLMMAGGPSARQGFHPKMCVSVHMIYARDLGQQARQCACVRGYICFMLHAPHAHRCRRRRRRARVRRAWRKETIIEYAMYILLNYV